MNARRALGPVAAAIFLHAAAAHAQPKSGDLKRPPAPTPSAASPTSLADSLTGDAKVDYTAARMLYGNADYAGALLKFQAAYEKTKDPRLLWNMAACEKSLRHYSSLTRYVRRYLSEGSAMISETERADAEALLKASEPLTAVVDLAVSESGARVYIDDASFGETPLAEPLLLDVGVHRVRVEKDGFESYREDLTIGDSPRVKLVARLTKASHDANLTIYTARPLDEIFVDGSLRGLGTWQGPIASGPHTVRVTGSTMRPYQTDITLADKETRTVALTLDSESRPPPVLPRWIWIAGATAVVAAVVVAGIILFQPEDRDPTLPVGTLDPGSVQASRPPRPGVPER